MYKYFQPNKQDLKDQNGDCVVRSLVKATGLTWLEVFDALVEYSRKYPCMPNTKPAYETFMKARGFEYHGISNKKGSKRPTVKGFSISHKDGTYVLVVANHLVCSSEGHYWDTWDSGDCCLYGYWEKH